MKGYVIDGKRYVEASVAERLEDRAEKLRSTLELIRNDLRGFIGADTLRLRIDMALATEPPKPKTLSEEEINEKLALFAGHRRCTCDCHQWIINAAFSEAPPRYTQSIALLQQEILPKLSEPQAEKLRQLLTNEWGKDASQKSLLSWILEVQPHRLAAILAEVI